MLYVWSHHEKVWIFVVYYFFVFLWTFLFSHFPLGYVTKKQQKHICWDLSQHTECSRAVKGGEIKLGFFICLLLRLKTRAERGPLAVISHQDFSSSLPSMHLSLFLSYILLLQVNITGKKKLRGRCIISSALNKNRFLYWFGKYFKG